MTDFDVVARLRRLEAENDVLKHRVAELERAEQRRHGVFGAEKAPVLYHDATTYKRLRDAGRLPIWPTAEGETSCQS